MAEQIDLTTPFPDIPGIDSWKVSFLGLDVEQSTISIGLVSNNGKHTSAQYTGAVAVTLLNALNKANLTVKSLQKRILERLLADGKFDGSVSGVPD